MRAVIAAALLAAVSSGAAAQSDGALSVELNKLEPLDGGCRSFFLFRNGVGRGFAAFEMALAILRPDGVIDSLLTIDAAPLPADRTTLKIFELPETACGDVGALLLHDIPACEAADGGEIDCFEAIELDSLADAALSK